MKKRLIFLSFAALTLVLAACGRPAEEVTPSPANTPAPDPTVMATATAAPTVTVTAVPAGTPTPEPAPVEVTVQPTPAPTVAPTPIVVPVPSPTLAPTPEPPPTLPPEEAPLPEPVPSEEPERPSDEMVLEAFRDAEEIYNWCYYTDFPKDREDVLLRPNGEYHRVLHPELNSVDELRFYLKTLFSDELVDALVGSVEYPKFLDGENGGLYVYDIDGRPDDYGPKERTSLLVIWSEEEPVRCTVQVVQRTGYPEEEAEQTYEFPYQKVGDKWVFTDFDPTF